STHSPLSFSLLLLPPSLSFFLVPLRPPPRSTLFPYTTLFRSPPRCGPRRSPRQGCRATCNRPRGTENRRWMRQRAQERPWRARRPSARRRSATGSATVVCSCRVLSNVPNGSVSPNRQSGPQDGWDALMGTLGVSAPVSSTGSCSRTNSWFVFRHLRRHVRVLHAQLHQERNSRQHDQRKQRIFQADPVCQCTDDR